MRYGRFDNENREYVIDRVDIPVSWTNYIGTKDMCGVFNHTAGGYLFCGSPEYNRITRFRANAVPMDRPGHYVYLRDENDGDYWSVSWQPVGKPLDQAKYECRHGLSYSTYSCEYKDISAKQRLFVAMDEPVEIWDVEITNTGDTERKISVYSYCEFSFHLINMDNQNFQMSLYATGAEMKDGVIEQDLHYEENRAHYFASSFVPDGFDCVRDTFIGAYHTESNPVAVEQGKCFGSEERGGNHCAALQKSIVLKPGETVRLFYFLGEGDASKGKEISNQFGNAQAVDEQFAKLGNFWEEKLNKLVINTPNQGMNTLINIWTLYQSEVNVMFSRFSSFVEVGGRTGLGYRDTAQDAMCIPHSNPKKCKSRLIELLRALTTQGYGLHLFEPEWFEEDIATQSFNSPTVVPRLDAKSRVHSIEDACSDDALWLVSAITNYVKETGELDFLDDNLGYADGGKGTVYEHMKRILAFSAEQVGSHGICKGLRADWNDCLNLGGGESAMVSFLFCWAGNLFVELAERIGKQADADKVRAQVEQMKQTCEDVLWDGAWYLRGFTASGRKIGTHIDEEGKVHMESNTWAVISGVASAERAKLCMDAVNKYLFTEYGLMLNAPPYTVPDDEIGFVTRVFGGIKENGAIFSHPNPWAWAAESLNQNPERAMQYYDALSPYNQNDKIEIRQAEPYSYCQFVIGKEHKAFGRARHPFMTGTAGWAYFAATQYILGIRPGYDELIVCPCLPKEWKSVCITRVFRGATYEIEIDNTKGGASVEKIFVDGKEVEKIPIQQAGTVSKVLVCTH